MVMVVVILIAAKNKNNKERTVVIHLIPPPPPPPPHEYVMDNQENLLVHLQVQPNCLPASLHVLQGTHAWSDAIPSPSKEWLR